MVEALGNLVDDPRLILAIPSAFIGLLPMTAGAMMGAPIVDEAAKRWDLDAGLEDVLQLLVPAHLGILLAALHQPHPGRGHLPRPDKRICGHPVSVHPGRHRGRARHALPARPVPAEGRMRTRRTLKDVLKVFFSIWPILLTIVLIFVFKLGMLAGARGWRAC